MITKLGRKVMKTYVKHFPLKINSYWMYMNPKNLGLTIPMIRGRYEIDSTSLFSRIIKPGWNVLDIGAYIGYYSIHFSKLVGPRGKVTAFEPDPYHRSLLDRNLRFQKVENVNIEPFALGDLEKQANLYVNAPESSLIKRNVNFIKTQKVLVSTLDAKLKGERVDLIKMDVQGYEYKILRGAKRVLKDNPKLILHTEFWPDGLINAGCDPMQMLKFIRGCGFKIFIIGKGQKDYSESLAAVIKFAKESPGNFIDLVCSRSRKAIFS